MTTILCSFCAWLGLAWGALTFPTTAPGEPANLAAANGFVYATRGTEGIEIVRLADGVAWRLPLAHGESADDLAIADGLLFVLDARPPGALSIYSLADPEIPAIRQPPDFVEVGPFSGVSAAAGRVVVSGGTGRLSLRTYTREGLFTGQKVSADFGRGQPDVLLAPDGRAAFVSTHVYGPHFRLSVAALGSSPLRVEPRGSVSIDGYGFTPGGAKPASFPIQTAIAGNLLLIAQAGGLALVDVEDPDAPRRLHKLEIALEPVGVAVEAGIAALVGSEPDPRLVLVSVSNPESPRVLGEVALPAQSRPTGVAISGSHVAVAAEGAGVLLFDREALIRNGPAFSEWNPDSPTTHPGESSSKRVRPESRPQPRSLALWRSGTRSSSGPQTLLTR